jgi:imidazole glycerol phosphate synthase glutamine amidotransferase subunit
MKVVIIQTDTANTASIYAAIERLGADVMISDRVEDIQKADHVVLPGVGTFKAAINNLKKRELMDTIRQKILDNTPVLAICLGLQLLCNESEESPGATGLNIINTKIKRFPEGLCVPHMGWNKVKAAENSCFLENGYAYFANSFYLEGVPGDWKAAHTTHGVEFVSAMEKGNVLACQFHPELSGRWGHELLKRWYGGNKCLQ